MSSIGDDLMSESLWVTDSPIICLLRAIASKYLVSKSTLILLCFCLKKHTRRFQTEYCQIPCGYFLLSSRVLEQSLSPFNWPVKILFLLFNFTRSVMLMWDENVKYFEVTSVWGWKLFYYGYVIWFGVNRGNIMKLTHLNGIETWSFCSCLSPDMFMCCLLPHFLLCSVLVTCMFDVTATCYSVAYYLDRLDY